MLQIWKNGVETNAESLIELSMDQAHHATKIRKLSAASADKI